MFSKNSHRNFIKRGGGGSKAVYKLYKKTGEMEKDGFPKEDKNLETDPMFVIISVWIQLI